MAGNFFKADMISDYGCIFSVFADVGVGSCRTRLDGLPHAVSVQMDIREKDCLLQETKLNDDSGILG